eukprot:gene6867-1226_t
MPRFGLDVAPHSSIHFGWAATVGGAVGRPALAPPAATSHNNYQNGFFHFSRGAPASSSPWGPLTRRLYCQRPTVAAPPARRGASIRAAFLELALEQPSKLPALEPARRVSFSRRPAAQTGGAAS